MKELSVYFEIKDLGTDGDGSACPVGMKLTMGETDKEIDYAELTADLNIPYLLKAFGIHEVIKPENVKVISPEEYQKEYAD